ncbi:MAG: peptide-binding protein [Candidatus Omnitrophota bacterium]
MKSVRKKTHKRRLARKCTFLTTDPRPLPAVFFLLVLMCWAGCGQQTPSHKVSNPFPDTGPAYGDRFVTGSIADPKNLIPILASDSASAEIVGQVFNGLVKYDKNIQLVGDLAEHWEIEQEGLEIVFHLRKNVRWHDGRPFTADDVVFTYQKLVDPAVKTPYSGDFEKIERIEKIDDNTLRVRYKEPFAPGLASWGMAVMPKHLLEKEDFNRSAFSRNPVGTGPYRFKQWKTAQYVELESNHDYFEGRPYLDGYLYRVIPDQATLFLELRAETVDSIGLTPLQYQRQTETPFFRSRFQKFRYPSFAYTYIGYNLKDPHFSDVRVRKALTMALDRREIIDGVLLGLGRQCTGPFVPESWAYNPGVKALPYDPEGAKRLLAEAGWKDTDGDGWLDRDGETFEFTLLTNQGNEQRKMIAELVQQKWQKLGIRVKIRVLEWSAFLSEFIDKKRFEAFILGWSLSRDPDLYDIWHSSKTREGEFNFIQYQNEEADRLMMEGRRTFDQKIRKAIYHKLHQLIYEDQPCTFLYVPDALPIVHARIKGIEAAPIGIGYNFIEWYVPRESQKYRVP